MQFLLGNIYYVFLCFIENKCKQRDTLHNCVSKETDSLIKNILRIYYKHLRDEIIKTPKSSTFKLLANNHDLISGPKNSKVLLNCLTTTMTTLRQQAIE